MAELERESDVGSDALWLALCRPCLNGFGIQALGLAIGVCVIFVRFREIQKANLPTSPAMCFNLPLNPKP